MVCHLLSKRLHRRALTLRGRGTWHMFHVALFSCVFVPVHSIPPLKVIVLLIILCVHLNTVRARLHMGSCLCVCVLYSLAGITNALMWSWRRVMSMPDEGGGDAHKEICINCNTCSIEWPRGLYLYIGIISVYVYEQCIDFARGVGALYF